MKVGAPQLLRDLLLTNDIAAAKKAKSSKSKWISEVTAMVRTLEPLIEALDKQCNQITDMPARYVSE